MQRQHAEHIGKQLATGIRGVLRELNDTVTVETFIGLQDVTGNKLSVMVDGPYPKTRTLVTFNGEVIGQFDNFIEP